MPTSAIPAPNEIHIRKATPDDARQIADFNREMAFETEGARLGPETTLAGVRRMIQDRNLGFYLVAESGREIVASLMITTEWSDWRNGVFWWIQSVYVMPRWRRKGIYRRLYEKVKELAEANRDVCGYRLVCGKGKYRRPVKPTAVSAWWRPITGCTKN